MSDRDYLLNRHMRFAKKKPHPEAEERAPPNPISQFSRALKGKMLLFSFLAAMVSVLGVNVREISTYIGRVEVERPEYVKYTLCAVSFYYFIMFFHSSIHDIHSAERGREWTSYVLNKEIIRKKKTSIIMFLVATMMFAALSAYGSAQNLSAVAVNMSFLSTLFVGFVPMMVMEMMIPTMLYSIFIMAAFDPRVITAAPDVLEYIVTWGR